MNLKGMPKYYLFCFLILVFSLNSSAQFTFSSGTANTITSGLKSVRLLNDVSSNAELNRYGGNLNAKTEAKGYFHTKRINGCWYIVDPDGCLFFTIGVCSVVKGGGIALPEALRDVGANTLGCWSDETINEDKDKKMAYCPRWNFMSTYKNTNQRTKDLFTAGIIPVFDPEYVMFCDTHAKQLIDTKNDSFLLGHFSDNELPVYDNTTYGNLLDRFLDIQDKSDPNYMAAKNWIVARKGENYTISAEDRDLFHGYLTGTYYKITGEAIKRYDPNHLYLGSRLHGGAKTKLSIFLEAAKYVDIISINVYGVWTPLTADMDMWSEGGAPFFVTEFYAKAQDSGLDNLGGAGWLVSTQADRAKFFENFTLALIEHPGCVGFHHFKYIDDDGSNKGLVSETFQWYSTFKNSFYTIARDIYRLRESMTGIFTGTNTQKSQGTIQFGPNPTSGNIHIFSASVSQPSGIEVFNLQGEKILHFDGVDFPYSFELPASVQKCYLLRVKSNNSMISTKVFKK